MKFLLASGGVIDSRFGIMTTPAHKGTPIGIVTGMPWAADNQVFTYKFDPTVYFPWLDTMLPYRIACLFVTVPDSVGDAVETLRMFEHWYPHFTGWPLAFVAQDGQEDLPLPDTALWDALFVGGSTAWKMSEAATGVIQAAQRMKKHIHIGRVNWRARYNHFNLMAGSEEFSADGTRNRFEGINKTMRAWNGYMAQRPLHPTLFGGNREC